MPGRSVLKTLRPAISYSHKLRFGWYPNLKFMEERQSYQFFETAINVRAVERQAIENSPRGLDRKDTAAQYQPRMDLAVSTTCEAELAPPP